MIARRIPALVLLLAMCLARPAAAGEEYWEYTFRPGDSIWNIAEQYTTSVNNWVEIQRLNGIGRGSDRRIPPGTTILIPVSMLKQQPVPAIVIAVSGAARLVRADGGEKAVEKGDRVYSGDSVVTDENQGLRIQFADQSELQVLANSVVVFDKLSHHKDTGMVDTRVRLNSGRVKTWVEKLKPESRYEIRTPAAVTAVRGTVFRLASTIEVSRTEVTEGTVAVAAGDAQREVPSGYGILAQKDKPLPEPVKLLPAPELSGNLSSESGVLKITWNGLDGAESYRYQLAADEDFDEVVADGSTEDAGIEIRNLQPGRYYLLVRGVDRFGLEGLDAGSEFDIQQPPAQKDDSWLIPVTVGAIILIL